MDWISRFDELDGLAPRERELLEQRGRIVSLPAGEVVFAPGRRPQAFLLLVEGTVVVRQLGAGGREIVLYRVVGGESCIMTTACLLSDEDYLAEGVTETPVTAVALGRSDFDALLASSATFRRLVFARFASRVTRLMEVVEDVAFERLDQRLARKLLELAAAGDSVDTTHQALAVELGSAREVISRQMKELSRRGWIAPGRGRVTILDREALAALAAQH